MLKLTRHLMLDSKSKRRITDTTEDIMTHAPQTYVLTLHSPSRKTMRLWTGKSIHALRHCSVTQIEHVLREMQQYVDDLQAPVPAAGRSYSLNRSR
jgi:hypothetical protein